jgi:hypothetical protein
MVGELTLLAPATNAAVSVITGAERAGAGTGASAAFSLAAAAGCKGMTDLALMGTATASSFQTADYSAAMAIDGDDNTRWASSFQEGQWLEVHMDACEIIQLFACHLPVRLSVL